jgi:hypothetical protein
MIQYILMDLANSRRDCVSPRLLSAGLPRHLPFAASFATMNLVKHTVHTRQRAGRCFLFFKRRRGDWQRELIRRAMRHGRPFTPDDAAEWTGLSKRTVGPMLHRLRVQGYLEAEMPDFKKISEKTSSKSALRPVFDQLRRSFFAYANDSLMSGPQLTPPAPGTCRCP